MNFSVPHFPCDYTWFLRDDLRFDLRCKLRCTQLHPFLPKFPVFLKLLPSERKEGIVFGPHSLS